MAAVPARLAAVLVVTGAAVAAAPIRTAEAPPLGFTGGFGEPSCIACHVGNEVNAFGGAVALEGLPPKYVPSREYVLTVLLQAEGTEVAGFMASARFSSGAERGRVAGSLVPMDTRVAVTDSAGVSYVHHTAAGSRTVSDDGASWSFLWVAPSTAGPVAINVAANSGNADNSPLSDLVYTAEVVVEPGAETR